MLEEILKESKSLFGDNKTALINGYKEYLCRTDYQIVKLYETFVQGGSIIKMLAELKEVLETRAQARTEINKLESEV